MRKKAIESRMRDYHKQRDLVGRERNWANDSQWGESCRSHTCTLGGNDTPVFRVQHNGIQPLVSLTREKMNTQNLRSCALLRILTHTAHNTQTHTILTSSSFSAFNNHTRSGSAVVTWNWPVCVNAYVNVCSVCQH